MEQPEPSIPRNQQTRLFTRFAEERRQWKRFVRSFWWGAGGCALALFALSHLLPNTESIGACLAFAWNLLTLLSASFLLHILSGTPVPYYRNKLALALLNSEDIRAVGTLAEALWFEEEDIRKGAAEALLRLLPRLTATDSWLLDDHQHGCLYRALALRGLTKQRADLLIAILHALEQIGDDRAVRCVEKLIGMEAYTASEKRVIAVAQQCLPGICARASQSQDPALLLRASALREAAVETLLRPAKASQPAESQQLLRVSASDQAEE